MVGGSVVGGSVVGGSVVVGGAVMTKEYADAIGADCYAKEAMDTVRYAEEILGKA